MDDCVFCKIGDGRIPAKKVAENEVGYVIADIQPQAKKHFLVIPKAHIPTLDQAFQDDEQGRSVIADLFSLGMDVAKKEGLLPGGFRSVINTNADGGQTVYHIHLHLLGGEPLRGTFA